jgi:hypothetical protein
MSSRLTRRFPRVISLFAARPDLRRKPGPTSPRSIEFSAASVQLHICACLLLITLCFGLRSSISPSGREQSSTSAADATTRAPPDDGGTPSISHSIQHTLLSVLCANRLIEMWGSKSYAFRMPKIRDRTRIFIRHAKRYPVTLFSIGRQDSIRNELPCRN